MEEARASDKEEKDSTYLRKCPRRGCCIVGVKEKTTVNNRYCKRILDPSILERQCVI